MSEKPFTISAIDSPDSPLLPKVHELLVEYDQYDPAWDAPEILARYTLKERIGVILVAQLIGRLPDEIVGTCRVGFYPPLTSRWLVAEKYRRRGIGTALTEAGMLHAYTAVNAEKMMYLVDRGNDAADAAYDQFSPTRYSNVDLLEIEDLRQILASKGMIGHGKQESL